MIVLKLSGIQLKFKYRNKKFKYRGEYYFFVNILEEQLK